MPTAVRSKQLLYPVVDAFESQLKFRSLPYYRDAKVVFVGDADDFALSVNFIFVVQGFVLALGFLAFENPRVSPSPLEVIHDPDQAQALDAFSAVYRFEGDTLVLPPPPSVDELLARCVPSDSVMEKPISVLATAFYHSWGTLGPELRDSVSRVFLGHSPMTWGLARQVILRDSALAKMVGLKP